VEVVRIEVTGRNVLIGTQRDVLWMIVELTNNRWAEVKLRSLASSEIQNAISESLEAVFTAIHTKNNASHYRSLGLIKRYRQTRSSQFQVHFAYHIVSASSLMASSPMCH